MKTAFISVAFKLRQPGQAKKLILNHVFTEYTGAMDKLIDWSKENLESIKDSGKWRLVDEETGEIKKEGYSEKSITTRLPSPSAVEADMAGCLKESLVKNVAASLAAYLQRDEQTKKEGFPTCRDPSPDAFDEALQELCLIGNDLEAEDEARAKLLKQSRSNVMPISFCRSRDFYILQDLTKKRFFLFLKLLPQGSPMAHQVKIDNLLDVNTGKLHKYNGKAGLLLPIEVGIRNGKWGWQYQNFVRLALAGQAKFVSGKLVRSNGDYFFHVSLKVDCDDPYEPQAYLGVDRGVFFTTAWAVVDKVGNILESHYEKDGFRDARIKAGKVVQRRQMKGQVVSVKHYRRKYLDEILHILANNLVEKAKEYQAAIVMEDLNIQIRGKFYKSAWKKLHGFVAHKCLLAGVPFKKDGVWPAWTSKLCIYCGEEVERDDRLVMCRHCGRQEHSDEAAAVNIARRAMYRKSDWGGTSKKPGDWRAFHRNFANASDFRAKNDLRKEDDIEEKVAKNGSLESSTARLSQVFDLRRQKSESVAAVSR